MKRALTGIAAAAVVLGTIAPAAFASTSSYTVGGRKAISVNGVVKSQLYTLVKKEGNIPTSYMGVWYLGEAVKAAGGSYTWDVSTKTFTITAPGVDGKTVAAGIPGGVGTGDTTIVVNGVTVKKVNSFFAKDPAGGSAQTTFLPLFYLGEVFGQIGGSSWDGSTFGFKNFATLAIGGNSTVGIGGKDALTLTANGTAVTSGVTWSVDGNGGAVVDANGNFVASAAGTYNVTATYGGQSFTAKVIVYGQAASVTLKAASDSVVANGSATDTVTATVVDANGNTVANFNGTATVAFTATGSNGAVTLPSPATVSFTNGVGTFDVTANSTAGLTDTITVNGLTSTNGQYVSPSVSFGTVAVSTANPGANTIKLSSSMPALSANSQTSAVLTVSVKDAGGATFNGATEPVTLTLTGPGSFDPTKSVTTKTIYVLGSDSTVTVYSQTGGPGTIQVTGTSSGLTTGTLSLDSFVNSARANLKVTSQNLKTTSGTPFTLNTVQVVDANGHLVTQNNGTPVNDALSISDNTANTSGTLVYNGYNTSTQQPSGAAPTTFTNGVAYFTVENTSVGSSDDTITVKDTAQDFTATAPYKYSTGAASTVDVSPSSSASDTILAGHSVTVSAQLVDSNDNNVSQAGQVVTFSFYSNTGTANSLFSNNSTTYQATTDANGVAKATITVPSTATGAFQYQAQLQGAVSPVRGATYTVTGAANYVSSLGLDGSTALPTNNILSAGGSTGTIKVDAKNAIAQLAATTTDHLKVTTSNPKILELNGGTYDAGTTDTYTITGNTGGVFTLPSITGLSAGSATITVKDASNPDAATYSFTLTVNPSGSAATLVEYNGKKISSTNQLTAAANTPVPVQIVNVDGGNNPVPVTGSAKVVTLKDTVNGGQYTAVSGGPQIGEVSIAVGQTSVTVYYINATGGTYTNDFSSNAGTPAANSAVASGITAAPVAGATNHATLTVYDANGYVDQAINGTYTVDLSGADATAGGWIGTSTNASTSGSGTTTVTFTNGVATVPFALNKAAAQTIVFTFDPSGLNKAATGVAVTPTAAAPATITAGAADLTSGVAGTAQPVTFVVKDAYGNVVANSNVTVAVTSTGGTAGTVSNAAAGTYAASATVATDSTGTATIQFKPGAAYAAGGADTDTLTATDGSATAVTTTFAHN